VTEAIRLILPKEHGSWSLAFEPIVFGLLVAPSWAGLALAGAASAGFFLRRPLKILQSPQPDVRQSLAVISAGVLVLIAVSGLLLAMQLGGCFRLWPLLPAALAGGLFVWFDARGVSREWLSEITGAAAFALLPATFASLAGWSAEKSIALAAVMLARSIPTVILVRMILRRRKNQGGSAIPALLAALIATLSLIIFARASLVPWAVVGFSMVFILRTGWLVTGAARPLTARQMGYIELVLGAAWIITVALAMRW
jgi:hypothetical protein